MPKPKKKSPRSLVPEPGSAPAVSPTVRWRAAAWRAIAFGDIHFQASTLDRGLRVLQRVAAAAKKHDAFVVFLGDWWELRGSLPVRQLDPLLDELGRWQKENIRTVVIPGNHDQVSENGYLHGVRVFEQFSNITVATERVLWEKEKIAFLPWRQDPEAQRALFDLPGEGWTIFAHAEVRGATTNEGHKAPGRIDTRAIKKVARACYCGHYHKRQKLGDRTWYVGSPFQHNFGERNDPPKGLALVTPDRVEPMWLHLYGFPKHVRLTYPEPFDAEAIQPIDIVELYATRSQLESPAFESYRAAIPAQTVLPLPLSLPDEEPDERPEVYGLSSALAAFVDQMMKRAAESGDELLPEGMLRDDVLQFANRVLQDVPEGLHVKGAAPEVRITGLRVQDFCARAGVTEIDLERQGLLLLKGPIGSGKTALVDALTWGLFGQTSPRKAASASASFRGDEVIHDDAELCEVVVSLHLSDGRRVTVRREKRRGKGATVQIQGIKAPAGISDSQRLIEQVVGLDYSLWRVYVSLGQGSVGNFVTDTDRARKALLAKAAGLDRCEPAQKIVRKKLRSAEVAIAANKASLTSEQRYHESLQALDYAKASEEWAAQHAKETAEVKEALQQAQTAIAQCVTELEAEPKWLEARKWWTFSRDELSKSLSLSTDERLTELHKAYGSADGERRTMEAALAKAQQESARLEAEFVSSPGVPCPTCGSLMVAKTAENYLQQKRVEVERLKRGIASQTERMRNLQVQWENLAAHESQGKAEQQESLAKANATLDQIGTALNAFSRIRANQEQAEALQKTQQERLTKLEQTSNPWLAKAAHQEEKRQESQRKIQALIKDQFELADQKKLLDFWDVGFGPKGAPALALQTMLLDLESYANGFLAEVLGARLHVALRLDGDTLDIEYYERVRDAFRQRRYEQLSGGQRRCVELAFTPFALSKLIAETCGIKIPLLVIDELTSHLGQEEKPRVCAALRRLPRETVLVIDHDLQVQGEFDRVLDAQALPQGATRKVA